MDCEDVLRELWSTPLGNRTSAGTAITKFYVTDISVKTSSLLVVVGISTMTKTDPFHTLQGLIQSQDQIVVMPRVNIATTPMPQEHTTTTATSRCETYCQENTRWMKTCCQGDLLAIAADICRMKGYGDENTAKKNGNEKGEKICPK